MCTFFCFSVFTSFSIEDWLASQLANFLTTYLSLVTLQVLIASRGKFHWLTPAKENTNQDPSSRPCLINSRLINSWKVLISYWQLTAGEFWQMVSALSYGIPVIFKTKNNKNWWISCTVAWNHAQIIYFFVLFQLLINQDFHCTALLDLA